MNAQEERKPARWGPNGAATLSSGQTLTQRKPVKGRRSVIIPTQLQSVRMPIVNPFLSLFILGEISHSTVSTLCPYIHHIMKC